jgi:hypothetical protein
VTDAERVRLINEALATISELDALLTKIEEELKTDFQAIP